MNYVRTLVSGKKLRFQDRKYNLDLSYITPRLIAMAFPGSGLEKIIRNSIDEVSLFVNRVGAFFLPCLYFARLNHPEGSVIIRLVFCKRKWGFPLQLIIGGN